MAGTAAPRWDLGTSCVAGAVRPPALARPRGRSLRPGGQFRFGLSVPRLRTALFERRAFATPAELMKGSPPVPGGRTPRPPAGLSASPLCSVTGQTQPSRRFLRAWPACRPRRRPPLRRRRRRRHRLQHHLPRPQGRLADPGTALPARPLLPPQPDRSAAAGFGPSAPARADFPRRRHRDRGLLLYEDVVEATQLGASRRGRPVATTPSLCRASENDSLFPRAA